MKGSGAKPYIIKNCGPGGYSCTCPAWRNQSLDPRIRTCKHITKLRGEEAEKARLGSTVELPSRKPEGDKEAAPVLLAEKWDGESNVSGWWMSEKLDGVRAYCDGKRFVSRNGNLYLAPDWFLAGLPSVPLDGELWIDRKKFRRCRSPKSYRLRTGWHRFHVRASGRYGAGPVASYHFRVIKEH